MALKKVTPNSDMYQWISHTWSPVKGSCPYGCSYCYVGRWGNNNRAFRLDERELRTDLGIGNFIFICSGCDLFHPDVPEGWIGKVMERTYSDLGSDNRFLYHTKNPERAVEMYDKYLPKLGSVLCVTVESNIPRPGISKAPQPHDRIRYLNQWPGDRMITIEPIMDFNLMMFSDMVLGCDPVQVNIGADSGDNHLPEPSGEEVEALINVLAPHIKVHLKKNLRRLLPRHRLYGVQGGEK